ncbi:MAG: GDP-mannose 6-dehydrogenase [Actinomycetota bacterium]|jgi:GDP-mannose 6-dehydrogenase|nr:GDP-mannose 6-dehydrogenase [Actinomycetota bacterium]
MKVAVFGLGYAGTVSAACLTKGAHDVWGVDVDAEKVEAVAAGSSPVVEPGLDELVHAAVAEGTLHATTDSALALDGADVAFVCVGTPSSAHGRVDLSQVERAVREIVSRAGTTTPPPSGLLSVVIRSTVPPGTIEDLVAPAIAGEAPPGRRYGVAMCPEFLREGSGVADFFDPPFTVIGTHDPEVGAAVAALFEFVGQEPRIVETRVAEALKYACNAFHATKVSFANELARLLRSMDVDARTVMELFCEDTRLNISPSYLRPGFAFGGSCLPKDLRALLHLARAHNVDLPLMSGTLASNELTVSEVVDRALATQGRKVALLGLSFKTKTDDLRESPNVELAERLLGKGLQLRIFDPIVNPSRLVGANRTYVESKLPHLCRLLSNTAAEALAGADVAIVSSTDITAVEALIADPPRVVIDISGRLGREVETLPGYAGIGW